jgi:hypothetical protein
MGLGKERLRQHIEGQTLSEARGGVKEAWEQYIFTLLKDWKLHLKDNIFHTDANVTVQKVSFVQGNGVISFSIDGVADLDGKPTQISTSPVLFRDLYTRYNIKILSHLKNYPPLRQVVEKYHFHLASEIYWVSMFPAEDYIGQNIYPEVIAEDSTPSLTHAQPLPEAKGDPESVFLQSLYTDLRGFSFPIDVKKENTTARMKGELVFDLSKIKEEVTGDGGDFDERAVSIPLVFKGEITPDNSFSFLVRERGIIYQLLHITNPTTEKEVYQQLKKLPSVRKFLAHIRKYHGEISLDVSAVTGGREVTTLSLYYDIRDLVQHILEEEDREQESMFPLSEARGGVATAWVEYFTQALKGYTHPVSYRSDSIRAIGELRLALEDAQVGEIGATHRRVAVRIPLLYTGNLTSSTGKTLGEILRSLADLSGGFCQAVVSHTKLSAYTGLTQQITGDGPYTAFDISTEEKSSPYRLGYVEFSIQPMIEENIYPTTQQHEALSSLLSEARGGIKEAWIQTITAAFASYAFPYTITTRGWDGTSYTAKGKFTFSSITVSPYYLSIHFRSTPKITPALDQISGMEKGSIIAQTATWVAEKSRFYQNVYHKIHDLSEAPGLLAVQTPIWGMEEGVAIVTVDVDLGYVLRNNSYPLTEQQEGRLLEARGGVGKAWKEAVSKSPVVQRWTYTVREEEFGPREKQTLSAKFSVESVQYLPGIPGAHADLLMIYLQTEDVTLRDEYGIVMTLSPSETVRWIHKFLLVSERFRKMCAKIEKSSLIQTLLKPCNPSTLFLSPLYVIDEKIAMVANIEHIVKGNIYPPSVNESSALPLDEARGGVTEAWREVIAKELQPLVIPFNFPVRNYEPLIGEVTFDVENITLTKKGDLSVPITAVLTRHTTWPEWRRDVSYRVVEGDFPAFGEEVVGIPLVKQNPFLDISVIYTDKYHKKAALVFEVHEEITRNEYPLSESTTMPSLPLDEARGGVEEAWRLEILTALKDFSYDVSPQWVGSHHIQGTVRVLTNNVITRTFKDYDDTIGYTCNIPLILEGEYFNGLSSPVKREVYKKIYRSVEEAVDDILDPILRTLFNLKKAEGILRPARPTVVSSAFGSVEGKSVMEISINIGPAVRQGIYPTGVQESSATPLSLLLNEAKGGVIEAWRQHFYQETVGKKAKIKITGQELRHYLFLSEVSGTLTVKDVTTHSIPENFELINFSVDFEGYEVDRDTGERRPLGTQKFIEYCHDQSYLFGTKIEKALKNLPAIMKFTVRNSGIFLTSFIEGDATGIQIGIFSDKASRLPYPDLSESVEEVCREALPLEEARGGVEAAWVQYVEQLLREWKYPIIKTIPGDTYGEKYFIKGEVTVGRVYFRGSFLLAEYEFSGIIHNSSGQRVQQDAKVREFVIRQFSSDLGDNIKKFPALTPLVSRIAAVGMYGKFVLAMSPLVGENIYPDKLSEEVLPGGLVKLEEARGGVEAAWVQHLTKKLSSYTFPYSARVEKNSSEEIQVTGTLRLQQVAGEDYESLKVVLTDTPVIKEPLTEEEMNDVLNNIGRYLMYTSTLHFSLSKKLNRIIPYTAVTLSLNRKVDVKNKTIQVWMRIDFSDAFKYNEYPQEEIS